jgi:hypothetical protein
MALISKILTLLQDNGFTVNPLKCARILAYPNGSQTMEKEN